MKAHIFYDEDDFYHVYMGGRYRGSVALRFINDEAEWSAHLVDSASQLDKLMSGLDSLEFWIIDGYASTLLASGQVQEVWSVLDGSLGLPVHQVNRRFRPKDADGSYFAWIWGVGKLEDHYGYTHPRELTWIQRSAYLAMGGSLDSAGPDAMRRYVSWLLSDPYRVSAAPTSTEIPSRATGEGQGATAGQEAGAHAQARRLGTLLWTEDQGSASTSIWSDGRHLWDESSRALDWSFVRERSVTGLVSWSSADAQRWFEDVLKRHPNTGGPVAWLAVSALPRTEDPDVAGLRKEYARYRRRYWSLTAGGIVLLVCALSPFFVAPESLQSMCMPMIAVYVASLSLIVMGARLSRQRLGPIARQLHLMDSPSKR